MDILGEEYTDEELSRIIVCPETPKECVIYIMAWTHYIGGHFLKDFSFELEEDMFCIYIPHIQGNQNKAFKSFKKFCNVLGLLPIERNDVHWDGKHAFIYYPLKGLPSLIKDIPDIVKKRGTPAPQEVSPAKQKYLDKFHEVYGRNL